MHCPFAAQQRTLRRPSRTIRTHKPYLFLTARPQYTLVGNFANTIFILFLVRYYYMILHLLLRQIALTIHRQNTLEDARTHHSIWSRGAYWQKKKKKEKRKRIRSKLSKLVVAEQFRLTILNALIIFMSARLCFVCLPACGDFCDAFFVFGFYYNVSKCRDLEQTERAHALMCRRSMLMPHMRHPINIGAKKSAAHSPHD